MPEYSEQDLRLASELREEVHREAMAGPPPTQREAPPTLRK